MGFFRRKKSDEIIDYSEMYRRGMIKASSSGEMNSDIIDFTKNMPPKPSPSSGSSDSGFDFLGSLAGAGSSVSASEGGSVTDSLRVARLASRREEVKSEVNELRIKLDDTSYKLESLMERVVELEKKLREFRS